MYVTGTTVEVGAGVRLCILAIASPLLVAVLLLRRCDLHRLAVQRVLCMPDTLPPATGRVRAQCQTLLATVYVDANIARTIGCAHAKNQSTSAPR